MNMMLSKQQGAVCTHRSRSSSCVKAFTPALKPVQCLRQLTTKATASGSSETAKATRREVLLGAGAGFAAAAMPQLPALAEEGSYATFYGYATPPTSYGGYGGNAKEVPKYSFEYPTGWKEEVPSKVEKGTQGIDGRVVNPRVKGQRVVVITLSRAGEDNKSFRLTDLDSTFAGFAGADYDLQDALTAATEITKSEKEVDGNLLYFYDIDSPEVRYLAAITVKAGKVFALFVKSPTKPQALLEGETQHNRMCLALNVLLQNFRASEAKLRHVLDTFTLL